MRRKLLLGLGLTASLLVVSGCSDAGDESAAEPSEQQDAEQPDPEQPEAPELPEPDLEGIPDVVAVVNGQEITKDEFVMVYEIQFQQVVAQAQMSGQELDEDMLKEQTAESLVGTELLMQESTERGFEATADDVDAELAELAEESGLESGDAFVEAMGQQGMDEQTVMAELEKQVTADWLLADEAVELEPTDAELQELYDQAVAQQEQTGDTAEIPPFEDVRPQLEQQVRSTKELDALEALVTELRSDADVTISL